MPFDNRAIRDRGTIASQLFDDTDRQRQKHEAGTNYLGGNRFEGHNTTNSPTTKLSATSYSLGTDRRNLQTVRDSGRAESIEKNSQQTRKALLLVVAKVRVKLFGGNNLSRFN